ncbi:hypothetical protein BDZ91DRAFT_777226 [Kalaharituber pfeilii]|nr:hypothetical protein BDZ91DRAFT_777226 [Kalaharituber pfeilii]
MSRWKERSSRTPKMRETRSYFAELMEVIRKDSSSRSESDMAGEESESVTTHNIAKGCEWRFEVAHGEEVEVKLLSGTAELFGTELPTAHKFTFSGIKAAIYTWHGCVLEVRGRPSVEYAAEETPMTIYANLHFALERIRGEDQQAQTNGHPRPRSPSQNIGPRIMLLGPADAGKTTLVKILTGYAIRSHRKPCVVNLDPREGVLSLPGTLTATSFSTTMDVEDGFGTSPTTAPSLVPVKLPLVYYYGFETPDSNTKLYKKLVSRMALAVTSRLGEDPDAQASGLIIDTPSTLAQTASYDLIQHIVADFGVTCLAVVGSERLYSDLLRRYESTASTPSNPTQLTTPHPVSVIKIPQSGGCVDRPQSFIRAQVHHQVKSYFFGESPKRTLSPYTMTIDFSLLHLYRITDSPSELMANKSLLPGGAAPGELALPLLERITVPDRGLTQCVVALMHCGVADPVEVVAEAGVIGFVYVVEVEEVKKRMKVLAPVAGRLPGAVGVVGWWPEAGGGLVG